MVLIGSTNICDIPHIKYWDFTMLQRKLQTTGKGSFILTLPIHVVLALGLKKGTTLEIALEKNHIVLTPILEVTRQDVDRIGEPTTA